MYIFLFAGGRRHILSNRFLALGTDGSLLLWVDEAAKRWRAIEAGKEKTYSFGNSYPSSVRHQSSPFVFFAG